MRIEYGENGEETCIFDPYEKDEIRLFICDVMYTSNSREIDKMVENVINRMTETGETKGAALEWCQMFC